MSFEESFVKGGRVPKPEYIRTARPLRVEVEGWRPECYPKMWVGYNSNKHLVCFLDQESCDQMDIGSESGKGLIQLDAMDPGDANKIVGLSGCQCQCGEDCQWRSDGRRGANQYVPSGFAQSNFMALLSRHLQRPHPHGFLKELCDFLMMDRKVRMDERKFLRLLVDGVTGSDVLISGIPVKKLRDMKEEMYENIGVGLLCRIDSDPSDVAGYDSLRAF